MIPRTQQVDDGDDGCRSRREDKRAFAIVQDGQSILQSCAGRVAHTGVVISKSIKRFIIDANINIDINIGTLSAAWSVVNWADLKAAQGAFGTDFYDRSTRTIVGTMLWTEYRHVIKIGPKGALGSHELRPIHSALSLGQSIDKGNRMCRPYRYSMIRKAIDGPILICFNKTSVSLGIALGVTYKNVSLP